MSSMGPILMSLDKAFGVKLASWSKLTLARERGFSELMPCTLGTLRGITAPPP